MNQAACHVRMVRTVCDTFHRSHSERHSERMNEIHAVAMREKTTSARERVDVLIPRFYDSSLTPSGQ